MKLSQKSFEFSAKVIEAIKTHPFNRELMQGTLARDKFAYYIEQDSLYLNDFARSLALIAAKAPLEYVRQFLKYSDFTFIAEQEIIHEFFRKAYNFKKTDRLTTATLAYTNYLLNTSANEAVEVAVAAVLPCFWVYLEVGKFIANNTSDNNPYSRWIETYSGDDFAKTVEQVINIFDKLAENTTESVRQKMLDAFYKSTCLEWHFWNDAYNKEAYNDLII